MRVIGISLLFSLLLLSCAGGDTGVDPATLTIPRAAADAVENAVAEKMSELQAAVETARAAQPFDADRLAVAFGELGKLYFAYEFYPASGTCFENAGKLAPTDHRWPYYEALVYQATGQPEQTIAALGRARTHKPLDLPTLIRLGDAHFDRGATDDAQAAYEEAVSVSGDAAAAWFGLGRVAEQQEEVETAISHLQRALTLQPEATVVHYRLGQLYRRQGDVEQARTHLEQRGTRRVVYDDPLGS